MTVEVAHSENIPEIIALCYQNFGVIGKNLPAPNTLKAIKSMGKFVSDGMAFVKKDENGTIVGLLVLTPFEFWWSNEPILHTVTFYVVPEHRKGNTAKELLEAAKNFANVNEVPLYLDIFTEDELETKDAFVRSQGFEKSGYIYRKK